jgi:hypothetical protein
MKKVLVTGVYSLIGNVIYRRLVAARDDDGAPATTFTVSHGGGIDLGFNIFYGVSDNAYNWVDIDHARDVVGYEPQDSAETA